MRKEDEARKTPIETVVGLVNRILPPGPSPLLVVSGGEPMLQQEQLCEVIDQLSPSVRVEIETAGTLVPTAEFTEHISAFNVSPKLAHSGNDKLKRYRPEALDALAATGKVQVWKFVAQGPSDLHEVDELVKLHNLSPVYIMPEGVTREELEEHSKSLIDAVIARGWHMTPRLHIQLWGNERGH